VDLIKQAKMQWLKDPNQNSIDDLNNVRPESSRNFGKKRRNISKEKSMKLKQTEQACQRQV
jgi:hypothetical protein